MSEDYAIIRASGKQFKVQAGSKIQTDRLEVAVGQEVVWNDVLLLRQGEQISVGAPTVSGASVKAKVVRHLRAPKVLIFKKRSKKGYKKMIGHRQDLTELAIEIISKN